MKRRLFLLLLGLIPGFAVLTACPAYGISVPSEPPDPNFELTDFTYQPTSPVTIGAQLTFTATANKSSIYVAEVRVVLGEGDTRISDGIRAQLTTWLSDSGMGIDAVADDGIYTGHFTLPGALGPMANLPVVARAEWFSSAIPPEIQGNLITIIAP